MKYGVDISRHQADNTITQLAKSDKNKFVIMRSSLGTYTVDSKLQRFFKDCKEYKYPYGFYHAAYAGTTGEAIEEADFCIKTIKELGVEKTDLPIFYDCEYFSQEYNAQRGINYTPQLVIDMTTAFCERVKERGFKTGVYTNLDWYQRFYQNGKIFADHPDYYFWYARPGLNKPDKVCYLWQYASNDGADFGYSGAIDKNILYGQFLTEETEIPENEGMKPLSKEPVPLYIGFASEGDIKKLVTKINGLGISTRVQNGYITTGLASSGDQSYILSDCAKLGVACVIYQGQTNGDNPEDKPEEKPDEPTETPTEPDEPTGQDPQKLFEIIKKIVKILYEFFYGE